MNARDVYCENDLLDDGALLPLGDVLVRASFLAVFGAAAAANFLASVRSEDAEAVATTFRAVASSSFSGAAVAAGGGGGGALPDLSRIFDLDRSF